MHSHDEVLLPAELVRKGKNSCATASTKKDAVAARMAGKIGGQLVTAVNLSIFSCNACSSPDLIAATTFCLIKRLVRRLNNLLCGRGMLRK